jgi:hypothetical protein
MPTPAPRPLDLGRAPRPRLVERRRLRYQRRRVVVEAFRHLSAPVAASSASM